MYLYFSLTIAFLFATLATTFINPNIKSDLTSQLTNHELQMYKKITSFRARIYYEGLLLGIIISIFYLFIFYKSKYFHLNIFVALTITFVINYFYYMLYPKPFYMLQILDSNSENVAWLKIYKYMQFRYHLAFLLGLIFSFFLYITIINYNIRINI